MDEHDAQTGSRWPLHALLAANAISGVGNQLTALAIPWFVLETTGSATQTGLVSFFSIVPLILTAVFGASIVDWLGFKRMSVVSDVLSGLTVGLIPLLHQTIGLAFWQLLALVFIGAILDAPGATARQSLFPDVATAAGVRLEQANAVASTIWRLSFLLGPPLGGLLIGLVGTSHVLWLDAASFGVSALLVAVFLPSNRRTPAANDTGTGRAMANMVDGLRFIASDRLLLWLAVYSTIGNALSGALHTVVLPVFARQRFDDATALGLLLGSFGAGALAGAMLYGMVWCHYPKRVVFIVSSIVSFIPIWILAAAPPLFVACGAMALSGLAAGPYGPIVTTIYQQRIPIEQRARFFGSILAADNAATPLAVVAAGLLLDTTSLTIAFVALGCVMLAERLFVLTRPVLRQMDSG